MEELIAEEAKAGSRIKKNEPIMVVIGNPHDVKFYLKTEFGASWVLSSWIVRNDEDFPRLTNVYPVDK